MKLAVIGSRNWSNQAVLENTLTAFCKEHDVKEIVLVVGIGGNVGVWTVDCKLHIPLRMFIHAEDAICESDAVLAFVVPEVCKTCKGERDFPQRNGDMLDCPVCNGRGWLPTRGTADTLRKARIAAKPCWVMVETIGAGEGKGEVREW